MKLNTVISVIAGLLTGYLISGCSEGLSDVPYGSYGHTADGGYDGSTERIPVSEKRRSLILYSAGYNNLTPYFKEDINDLCGGYLPFGDFRSEDQLFIFAHHTASNYDYRTPSSPHLIKVFKDRDGGIVRDTLVTYPATESAISAETLREVLEYIRTNYPSREYGVIFSSHATGWLPERYYSTGSFAGTSVLYAASQYGSSVIAEKPVHQPNFFQDGLRPREERDALPDVKSFGAEYAGSSRNTVEFDIKEFAEAIPFKLDYIIFDACLMGGIEVAYELKDVCKTLVFSQTQVLADGFDYTNIADRILNRHPSDLIAVAEDFFRHYDMQSGQYRSATISVIDCSALENLASVCNGIFSSHRGELDALNSYDIQKNDNLNICYFYDFADILDGLSLTSGEKSSLDNALGKAVIYKAATEYFLNDIEIKTHSGLSMYLPSAIKTTSSREALDRYYGDFKWNKASGYVTDHSSSASN